MAEIFKSFAKTAKKGYKKVFPDDKKPRKRTKKKTVKRKSVKK